MERATAGRRDPFAIDEALNHALDIDAGAAGAGIEEGFDDDDAPVRPDDDVAYRLRSVVMPGDLAASPSARKPAQVPLSESRPRTLLRGRLLLLV